MLFKEHHRGLQEPVCSPSGDEHVGDNDHDGDDTTVTSLTRRGLLRDLLEPTIQIHVTLGRSHHLSGTPISLGEKGGRLAVLISKLLGCSDSAECHCLPPRLSDLQSICRLHFL